jgi:hypothetical protein
MPEANVFPPEADLWTEEIALSEMILLGAFLVPFFLIAAMIGGSWRANRERASRRRQIKDFE